MKIVKLKTITTYNQDGKETGYITELVKQGNKTIAYMNVFLPKAFKGYQIHTERTERIYCLGGEVAIYTKVDDFITVTPLSANSGEVVIIPSQTPIAIENIAVGNSVLLFFPDPHFDPADTGEMIPVRKEDVEKDIR